MEVFVQAIADGNYDLAIMELESKANCFGFYHDVPKIAEALELYPINAIEFSTAFLKAMVQRFPDGRDEKSIGIAKEFLEQVNPTTGMEADVALRRRIVGASMHPTVMQQAAQLAFYVLGQFNLVPESIRVCDTWWRMPLI